MCRLSISASQVQAEEDQAEMQASTLATLRQHTVIRKCYAGLWISARVNVPSYVVARRRLHCSLSSDERIGSV